MLIDLLRRKVRLNQPYAGVFLKRDDGYVNNILKDRMSQILLSCVLQQVYTDHQTIGEFLPVILNDVNCMNILKNTRYPLHSQSLLVYVCF